LLSNDSRGRALGVTPRPSINERARKFFKDVVMGSMIRIQ